MAPVCTIVVSRLELSDLLKQLKDPRISTHAVLTLTLYIIFHLSTYDPVKSQLHTQSAPVLSLSSAPKVECLQFFFIL